MTGLTDELPAALSSPIPSLRTPFTVAGEVDWDGVRSQVDFDIAGGARTIMITWGDSLHSLLTDDEVAQLAKTVVEHSAGRAKVIAADNMWATPKAVAYADHLRIDIDARKIDLAKLKVLLRQKRTYLLTLMENPNLLEHDRFTDLLWAVTHLDEELEARDSLESLPEHDLEHLAGDIQRMYDHLASEWLDYVAHLKANYPFLFSLVARTHPFQESPSPVFV